ncbi:hypothetical protein [Scytonema sp. NUACC26]|uniref:hypothetical protein n=1 Tax=Scytonema sp. NUACC26 TaxID=3140176 RepID=UPI0034DC5E23
MNHTVGRGARHCAPTAVVYLPENGCNLAIPLPIVKRGDGSEVKLRNVTSVGEVKRPEK